MDEIKGRNDSEDEQARDLEQLLARPMSFDELPLRVWTLRVAEPVACEIESLARLKRMSVNSFVVSLFDQSLRQNGRPSVQELAPTFVEYLRRRGGRKKPAPSKRSNFDPFAGP